MGKGSWPRWPRRSRLPSRLLDLQEFRDQVAVEISKRFPASEVDQFGDDGIWIVVRKDEPGFSLYVTRFHALYCQAPRDLERLIGQLARFPERKPYVATEDSLRLMVRPDTYLTATAGQAHQICRHIAGPLWALVAVDEGDAIGFPSASDLQEDLQIDDAAIWNIALANTRQTLSPIELPAVNSVQIFAAEAGYISSCLADDELWQRLDREAPNGLLVVPLELNVLAVFGSFSSDAAFAVPDLVTVSEASADHLSSVALTRREGRWIEAAEIDRAFAPSRFKH
jgi:hypothetical protein